MTAPRSALARLVADLARPRRPAWRIRAVARGGLGLLVATVPAGVARTPAEAIAWYRRHRQAPLFRAESLRAFPEPRT